VTVVPSGAFEDEAAASNWLERCRRKADARDAEAEAAVLSLNRVIAAQRLAAGDPYVREVTRGQAQRARLGFGTGEELVGGIWRRAYTLPAAATRASRRAMLAPQEELAAILAGRRPRHLSEDLVLRARLDLDQARPREAALQLSAALEALARELATGEAPAELRSGQGAARQLADAALANRLSDADVEALDDLIGTCERTVRRRRYRGAAASASESSTERLEGGGEMPSEPSPTTEREQ
jgi:hypothetical protein